MAAFAGGDSTQPVVASSSARRVSDNLVASPPKAHPSLVMTLRHRDDILALLLLHSQTVAERFGASRLALFGSAARDQLHDDSDVDVLVEFVGTATYDAYFGLKSYLEQLLGRRIDLVTEAGLKPRARQSVARDLIRVA